MGSASPTAGRQLPPSGWASATSTSGSGTRPTGCAAGCASWSGTAGRLPAPEAAAPPPAGTPLFGEIVRRQVDSFDGLVRLPLRFWTMTALHPARPNGWSRLTGLGSRGAATVRREWPRIRAGIDVGQLPQVGLVRVAGPNPLTLGRHHQVLAWGYRLDAAAGTLAIRIYDPNWPGRDDVELLVGLRHDASGRRAVTTAQSTGEPLLALFEAPYSPP